MKSGLLGWKGVTTLFRKLYNRLASLNLGLWLIGGLMLLLGLGSFSREGPESGSINELPLLQWLRETSIAYSWWLWLAIGLLVLLTLNTICCSIESVRGKYGSTRFLILIAPQVMHAGFLLIVLAHLCSAWGGYKQTMPVQEGGVIGLPDGGRLQVTNLAMTIGPMGFPTDFSAQIRAMNGERESVQTIRPNEPFFYKGIGFYLKEVAFDPYRAALLEIHREPGAGLALVGALFFSVGNVVLLSVRRER